MKGKDNSIGTRDSMKMEVCIIETEGCYLHQREEGKEGGKEECSCHLLKSRPSRREKEMVFFQFPTTSGKAFK